MPFVHMPLTQALSMGVLQGLAEFAPISSSAHLVLVPWLVKPWTAHWIEDPGQGFDAALHIGTAAALIVYFWPQWKEIISAWFGSMTGKSDKNSPNARMGWLIILATIPGAIFGKLFEHPLETLFDTEAHPWAPAAIGLLLAIAGLVLLFADRMGKKNRGLGAITRGDAILIGLSQALALFPGVSRSGATITAGLALGLNRPAAARFSFLMATPITLGAGLLKLASLRHMNAAAAPVGVPQPAALVVGIITSALVGYMVIKWLLNYLQSQNMNLFVGYRVVAGLFFIAIWVLRGHPGL